MLNSIAELIQCLPPPHGDATLTAEASLRARVDQLSAELEALSVSRAEALANAIEEREKRIAQHEQHVQLLQTVMMQAAEGFVTFDAEGTIESFNEAAARIFGCEPAEAVGGNLGMIVALGPADGGAQFVAGGLTPGPCREFVGRRNDGSLFPLDVAVSEVELHPRSIYTAVCRDITERKQADAELRRLHLQNEMILNSAGEGILGLDREGTVIFANPAAARMLGWDVAEATGRGVSEVVHGCPHPLERHAAQQCLAHQSLHGDAGCLSGSEFFVRRDGTRFPIDYTWRRTAEECGPVTGVLTFRDISEQRRLEAQLRQAQKLESIGQLAAGIAHEINTPTQFIGDNLRFLEEGFRDLRSALENARRACDEARDPQAAGAAIAELRGVLRSNDLAYLLEEIPRALSQSRGGVERVVRILRSMREFSHPGGDTFEALDLNRAIESTLVVARNEYKYVADVETQFDGELPPVQCLPGDVNQVLLNLIINAAHAIRDRLGEASTERGVIAVATRCDGDHAEIRIRDTGTGIPEAIRSRVYDPFFTTKEVGRGTGQGLAITHAIVVEKHHGAIHFETELGQGTTFVVRLPLRQKTTGGGEP